MYLVSSARSFMSTSVKCGKAAVVAGMPSEALDCPTDDMADVPAAPTCMCGSSKYLTSLLRHMLLCNCLITTRIVAWCALNETNRWRCRAFVQFALSS